MKVVTFNELREQIDSLLDAHESFHVIELNANTMKSNWDSAIALLEASITKHGMRSRVYTANRATVMAGAVIPNPITVIPAILGGAAIGVHNLLTFNPDYEICKHSLKGYLEVNYKKSKPDLKPLK